MVAIVAGNGVGLANSSLSWLGQGGVLGDAQQGRGLDRVYVNAATGNLAIQRADELLAGVGPDVSTLRTYNSLGVLASDFDNQDLWLPGLYKKVYGLTGTVNTSGSTITRRDSDGTEIVYTYNVSAAAYLATDGDGAHDSLTYSSNVWTWTDGSSRFTETYDNLNGGRITTRKDPDLNTLTYTYNGSGYVTQVASSNGESTYLDYTGAKLTQIRTVTNGGTTTATRVRYGYDANNRLSTVTVDLSPGDNSITDAKTYVTTYTYHSTSNRVASITQSDGSRVDFAYTLVGSDYRVTQVTQDPLGLNRITTIAYNTGTRTTTITDPMGQSTVMVYDTSNRLLSVTGPSVGGSSQTVTYAYDGSGNVSQVTDARGNVTVYGYDANGNRTSERDAAGNTVTRTYSTTNQLLTQTVYAVPDPDGAGSGQPSAPSTTRYAYDAEEHLRFVVSGNGAVSESRYNAAGQLTQSIQYTGAIYDVSALGTTATLSETTLATWAQSQDKTDTALVAYTYDVRGLLASATRYTKVNASGQGVADGTQATTNYVYDAAGNLLSTVDPRGVATTGVANDYITSYVYDGLNRLTSSTAASLNGSGPVTLIQYDDANRKTVTTAANGLISTATYDKAGSLVSVVKSDATPTTFGETKYYYDANGRLRMVKDPTGVNSHSLYDAAGRKVADIDAAGNWNDTAKGTLTEYIYNANNQIVSTIRYATAVNLSLLADGSGNPISVALSSVRPSANASDRRTWTLYDTAGRVVKTVDEMGAVVEYLYDGRSQRTKAIAYANTVTASAITATTLPTDTAVSPTANANDRVTRYFYDNDGHSLGVLDAEGFLTEYKYDAAGRQIEMIAYKTETMLALRATGSLASLASGLANAADVHTYQLYNASGQRIGDVDAEGYLTEYVYDLAGNRTQSIRYSTAVNANYLASRSVTLTVQAKTSGAAISMGVNVNGVAAPGSPMSVTSTSYAAYNFTVSLASWLNHAVDIVFTDAGPDLSIQSITLDGQLVNSTDATTTFDAGAGTAAFDGTGVVAGAALMSQSGALRFAVYGLPRLRPTTTAGDQTVSATYDPLNRVASQTSSDGTVTQYAYDDVGNLISKTSAYGTAEVRTLTYKYDRQGQVVGELTGVGSNALVGLVNQVDIDGVWNAYGLKHAYDAAGRRISTTDAIGNKTLFYYNADGQLTHTINAKGEVFESQYNALNQLTKTVQYTLRLSSGSLTGLTGGVADAGFLSIIAGLTSATLDAHRQLQYDLAGRVTARVDALGYSTTYGYNTFGEETSRTTPIDASNSLVQATGYDRRGLATQTTADSAGINLVQSMTYDAFGRLVNFTDGNGNLTVRSYDRLGRVVQVKDAFNKNDGFTYDAFNRVLSQTDRLGNVTNYLYDTANRSVVITTQEGVGNTAVKNRHGQAATQTDGKGGITTFSYDKDGNLVSTVGPIATTTSVYDVAGRLVQTTDARGIKTAYTYDEANRLSSRTVDIDDPAATPPRVGLKLVTNYTYDGQGRSVSTQDPKGVWTQTEYDKQGQVTAVIVDPTGLAIRTEYTYDRRGKTLTVTEGAGSAQPKVTQYVYDKLGRRTQERVDPSGLNLTTTYAYDKNNNVTTKTDAAGQVTRYYYDAEDRLIYTLDPLKGLVARSYDDKGQVTQVMAYATAFASLSATPTATDIQSAIVTYANATIDQASRSVYDRDGREVYTIDALGFVTKKTFDANSNVISQTRYATAVSLAGSPTPAQVASAVTTSATLDRTTKFVYDAANRLRYTVDALGYVKETRYDAGGLVTQSILRAAAPTLSATPTLAELDAIYLAPTYGQANYSVSATLTNTSPSVSLSWSTSSQPVGSTVTFQYAPTGSGAYATSDVSVGGGNNTVTLLNPPNGIYQYLIEVSVGGKVVERSSGQFARTAPATTSQTLQFVASQLDRSQRFEYDAAARLVTTFDDVYQLKGTLANTAPSVSLTWSNALRPAGSTTTFRYSPAGASSYTPVTVTSANGTDSISVSGLANGTYDYIVQVLVDGIVVQESTGQFARTAAATTSQQMEFVTTRERFAYDAVGNKVGYTNKKGSVWTYVYDAAGRLTSETTPMVEVTTVTPSGNSLGATTEAVSLETRIAYNALGNVTSRTEAFGRTEARTTTYYYDAAGRQTSTKFPEVWVYRPDDGNSGTTGDDDLTTNGTNGTVSRTEMAVNPQNYVTYDAMGRAVVNQDVAGNYSYKVYDAAGRIVYEIDAERYVTRYTYDAFGNKLTTTRYATALDFGVVPGYTAHSNGTAFSAAEVVARLGVANSNDRVITSTFDKLNRTTQVVEPAAFTYDSGTGNIATVGRTTANVYNRFGEVIKQTVGGSATTYYFDRLGNKTAQVDALGYVSSFEYNAAGEMTRQVEYAQALTSGSWNETTLPAATVTTLATASNSTIGFDRESLWQYDRKGQKIAESRIGVQYSTLGSGLTVNAALGNLTTTYGYDAVGNLTRTTDASGASTYTYFDALGRTVATAEPTREVNSTGGVIRMPPVGYSSATQKLSFDKPLASGINVVFKYKVHGASTWITATLVSEGNLYTVLVSALPTDIYQYEMVYTKASDGSTIATGTGTFEVQTINAVGSTSTHAASFVDQRTLGISTASATYGYVAGGEGSEGGYAWSGTNVVNLTWSALDNWQGGTVRVIIDYRNKNTNGSAGAAAQRTVDLVLPTGLTGTQFAWAPVAGGLYAVDRVRVLRFVTGSPATTTTIHDTSAAPPAERLILQGNTTNITGIDVAGVGVLSATALGLGVYSVNLSTLARGTYTYTVQGTTSSVGGTLEVKMGTVAGSPVLQEQVTAGTWRLSGYNLPGDTSSAILQYRRSGDTGPFLIKTLVHQSNNEWTASYDDIAGGSYDYQIIAQRPSGQETYPGASPGTVLITRGASHTTTSQSQSVAQSLTPLTVVKLDAFGAAAQQTRYALGAASISDTVYAIAGANAADQTTTFRRDSQGHVTWTQDAEGKASYASYDVLGQIAKEWRPITDNDGRVQNAIRVFKYDKLGRQIETLEPSFLPTGALVTSSTTQAAEDTTLSFGISQQATRGSLGTFSGSNIVSVNWGDMSAWGTGQVRVTVFGMDDGSYAVNGESGWTWHYGTATARQFSTTFASTAASGSVSSTGYILASITKVRVEKQDAAGNWIVIHNDRTTSSTSAYGKVVAFLRPSNLDTVQVKYRQVGAGTWTTADNTILRTFGNKFVFDFRGLANANYEYETLYTGAGETSPYARLGATFTVNGGSSSFTPGSNATSHTIPALNPASYLQTQAAYNAFGEVTAKGINNAWQESYEYNNAGLLWRSNSGDGVTKVNLYDIAGNATALISGLTVDLSTAADALQAYNWAADVGGNLPGDVIWTRSKYDALGRTTQQIQPTFTVTSESSIAPRGSESLSFNFSTGVSGANVYTSANWTNMSAWGAGAVQLYVNYSYRTQTGTNEQGQPIWSGWTATAAAVTLAAGATNGSVNLGVNAGRQYSVSQVRVFKQDVLNAWQTVHDRPTTPGNDYKGVMTWLVPMNFGTVVTVETKPTGSGSFTSRSFFNFGGKLYFNPAAFSLTGNLDYRITYVLPGGAGNITKTGTFNVTGATLTVNNDPDTPTVTTLTPTSDQTFDRWGNVLSMTDPRPGSLTTTYKYNSFNARIQTTLPPVTVGLANGTLATNQTPTSYAYFDLLGRQIATKDANNNINATVLDAAGQLIRELHADGGEVNFVYDAFGRKTRKTDALGNATTLAYDRMNRLTGQQFPIGSQSYVYDEIGNRIQETNALGETNKYWFDTRGKLIQSRLPMGQESANFYDQRGNVIQSIDANGNVGTWEYDYFGRVIAHTDLGGETYGYTYDPVTKKLTGQTSTWDANLAYTYYEDGKAKTITDTSTGTVATTKYEYDAAGNRTRETYSVGSTVHQDTRLGYDALGRMIGIVDVRDTVTYVYDAVGNRRRTTSTFFNSNNVEQTIDNWYLYDSMNRITLSQGVLQGGVIQIRAYQNATTPAQGMQLAYDGAGNRRTASFYQGTSGTLLTETYNYDINNQLTTTSRGGVNTSSRTYNAAGRVTQTIAYSAPGTVSVRKDNTYNANGWLTQTDSFNGGGTLQSRVLYTAFDNLGNVNSYSLASYVGTAYTNYYNYTYQLRDTYKEATIAGTSTYFQAGSTTSTYDANGFLTGVNDQFATNKVRSFINNQSGQILKKTEGSQIQYFFYANGNPIGSSGIVNGSTVIVNPDFDYNYTPVNDRYPAATPGSYVVSEGDTLQGIAFTMFGDASLWYIIADANGLQQDTDLIVGKTLAIPNKITNLRNAYDVFKPYKPGDIIGDTTPTLPDPPPPPVQEGGGGGCGSIGKIVGQILVVVVQIIVTAYFGPIVGNIAGQLVGMAVGVREKFSWKEVAVAWLTQGADKIGASAATASGVSSTVGQQIIQGAVSNIVTQGVSVALGVQEKFDWRGVAVAAISAPISKKIESKFGYSANGEQPSFTNGLAAETAKSIAKQGVSILVNGGGKMNWAEVATDAFGNALGNDLKPYFKPVADKINDGIGKIKDFLTPTSAPEKVSYIEGRSSNGPVADTPRGINMGGAAMAALEKASPQELQSQIDDVEEQLRLDLESDEILEDSVLSGEMVLTAGASNSAPRTPVQMVKNGNWDAALNFAADPLGVLGELPGLRSDLAKLDLINAEKQIDRMRQSMIDQGMKNVPGYSEDWRVGSDGVARNVRNYESTVKNLETAYESFVRDRRLRETWGDDYQNLRIGKSQMTVQDFEKKVLDRQLQATDRAYAQGVEAIAKKKLEAAPGDYAKVLGSYIDQRVRTELRAFARSEGINDSMASNIWAVNRKIQSNLVAGWGVPDNRIGLNILADTSLTRKNSYTEQVMKWNAIIPNSNVLIVRPSELGGAYSIPRTTIPQVKGQGRKGI